MSTTLSSPSGSIPSSGIGAHRQSGRLRRWQATIAGVFVVYAAVRLLAWSAADLLEDADSVGYLVNILVFRNADLRAVANMGADATPFYPFFSALFMLPGLSAEAAARLCSFVFSMLLFAAVAGIGRRIAPPVAVVAGLVLLSLDPFLTTLSYAVLTEPSYIATVYTGLWLFWSQFRNPTLWKAAALGVIFGLAFLNRFEGLLFLAAVPVAQLLHAFFAKTRSYSRPHLLRWAAVYGMVFTMVAAPQVWRVSQKMGGFALNGRQVWSQLLTAADGRSADEVLYGLDWSPSQINRRYLQQHPEARAALANKPDPLAFAKLAVRNVDLISRDRLGILVGPLAFGLFVLGLVGLARRGRGLDAVLVVGFLGTALTAPLLQTWLLARHLAVLAPMILLVAGIGAVEAGCVAVRGRYGAQGVLAASLLAVALVLAGWLYPLSDALAGVPMTGIVYDRDSLTAPAAVLAEARARDFPDAPPRVATRQGYIAWMSGTTIVPLPFTDYAGLVTYLRLNEADFLYLDHRLLRGRPFAAAFADPSAVPDFELIYRGAAPDGAALELYRFLPDR